MDKRTYSKHFRNTPLFPLYVWSDPVPYYMEGTLRPNHTFTYKSLFRFGPDILIPVFSFRLPVGIRHVTTLGSTTPYLPQRPLTLSRWFEQRLTPENLNEKGLGLWKKGSICVLSQGVSQFQRWVSGKGVSGRDRSVSLYPDSSGATNRIRWNKRMSKVAVCCTPLCNKTKNKKKKTEWSNYRVFLH